VTGSDTIKYVEPEPITATVALEAAAEALRDADSYPGTISRVEVADGWMRLASLIDALGVPVSEPTEVGFR
jgi:hypothetical protein